MEVVLPLTQGGIGGYERLQTLIEVVREGYGKG